MDETEIRRERIPAGNRGRRAAVLLVALAAIVAILIAVWHLAAATEGLAIRHTRVGSVPITIYRPQRQAPAPAVVIAHGFAGSQRLMQAYAITLARNGYIAVTFDFAGHGRNTAPFVSSLNDRAKRLRVLLDGLEPAVALALAQPGADGRLALVGHSMAGDVLARYAEAHPRQVSAVVLLSPYLSDETRTKGLPNLLLVYGALEPEMLHRQGLEVLSDSLGPESQEGPPRVGVTYGHWSDGSARRMRLADGVEHIGELFSGEAITATLDWLDRSFDRSGDGFVDRPAPWLGLLYLGLIALAWPLSRLLPVVSTPPAGAGLSWRRLLPVATPPAVLTPLVLWKAPTDFLPILIGDYLALHFAVYGLITWLGLGMMRARRPLSPPGAASAGVRWMAFLIAAAAVAFYTTLVLGGTTDYLVTTLLPGPERFWVVTALLVGTLSYFTADEWLTRGPGAARGGYALTKLLFLLSLILAVLLKLSELFFLIIIVPAILVFFVVYGLMSGWVYRRTGQPLVGAIANAAAFAAAIAATFPMVGA